MGSRRLAFLSALALVVGACAPNGPGYAPGASVSALGGDAGCGVCNPTGPCDVASCQGTACVHTPVLPGVGCGMSGTEVCVAGQCQTSACGDGVRALGPSVASEGCDDGNTVSGDGCDSACVSEVVEVDPSSAGAYSAVGTSSAQNVGVDGASRALVVYRRRAAGREQLWARRLSAYGLGSYQPFVIDPDLGAVPTSADPTVVGMPGGGWVVAWSARRGTSLDIVFRRIAPDGALLGNEVIANRQRFGTQWDPELVALSTGFVVAWTDLYGIESDPEGGVVARVFDANGAGRTEDLRVATDREGSQALPTLAAFGDRWMIGWQTENAATDYLPDVRVRAYEGTVPVGTDESVLPFGPCDMVDLFAMARTATFGFVARYLATNPDGDMMIGQFRADGEPLASLPGTETMLRHPSFVHTRSGFAGVYENERRGRAMLSNFAIFDPSDESRLRDVFGQRSVGALSIVEDGLGTWVAFQQDAVGAVEDRFSVFRLELQTPHYEACDSPSRCGADGGRGACFGSLGGYYCACAAGYEVTFPNEIEADCTDIDECLDSGRCSGHGTCENLPGSARCDCDTGWTGEFCDVDIDECLTNNGGCSVDPMVPCTNAPGSFSCGPCPGDYVGNGFVCTMPDCGMPPAPANGSVDVSGGTLHHDVATYACDVGFSTSGAATRTCMADSSWSGAAPTCPAVPNHCPAAPSVTNAAAPLVSGGVAGGSTPSYQATAAYTCSAGYTKDGGDATCQANGTWSAAPTCTPTPNHCPSAPTVTNAGAPTVSGGIAGGSTTSLSATAAYTCNTGYTKSGTNPTCQANGTWSAAPTCTATVNHCPAAPTVANAAAPTISGGIAGGSTRSYMATAAYTCNTGYTKSGTNPSCQANGTWSAAPTCTATANYCPVAPTVTNAAAPTISGGVAGGSTRSYQATAAYTCNVGYSKSGSDATCQANATWSAAPTCTPNPTFCLAPPTVANAGTPTVSGGIAGGSTTSLSATAAYTCLAGYTKSGSDPTCQASATWSAAPTCAPVDCGALTAPTNGSVATPAGTTFGQTAQYTCNVNYALHGSATRNCQANGTWEGTAPTCDVPNCGTPPMGPRFVTPSYTTTTLNSQVTYSCALGFRLSGPSSRTCGVNEQWSGATPWCVITGFAGDFDSDGSVDDHVTWNPSTGQWAARTTASAVITMSVTLGGPGDVPLVGDFDADGVVDDVGVYTPSLARFQFRRRDGSNPLDPSTYPTQQLFFGLEGDIPLVGDLDGDGYVNELALYRPTNGRWYAIRIWDFGSVVPSGYVTLGGGATDLPMIGDADADAYADDFVVFTPGASAVFRGMSTAGTTLLGASGFTLGSYTGLPTDVASMAALDSDGLKNDFVVYRVGTTASAVPRFYARRQNNTNPITASSGYLSFGLSSYSFVVGNFDSGTGASLVDDYGLYNPGTGLWYARRANNTNVMNGVQ